MNPLHPRALTTKLSAIPAPDASLWQENPRAFLQHLFAVAVQRAMPLYCLKPYLPQPPKGRTVVIGAGKAAGSMAQALEALWPADAPLSGAVVTRYQHTPPRPAGLAGQKPRIDVLEAAHPVPDAAGLAASARMLELVQGLTADDLVIALISGGGSALLTLPAEGLTLADKQVLNQALLASGAHIGQMNCVRKHLSRIKGGRLAQACVPAQLLTLAISDVPGDDPATIASGPTVPDTTTCADALALIERLHLPVPPQVLAQLHAQTLETPKPGDACFEQAQVHVVATPAQALLAAAQWAQSAGLRAYVMGDAIEGESSEVGQAHAAWAQAPAFQRPCVILSGGETTVTLRAQDVSASSDPMYKPQGGRAGEYGLGLAKALAGQAHTWAIAADTDGIDGSQDNAGVLVAPDTLARSEALGVHMDAHLRRHDSYGFFKALDDLVVTGPTFTNVNDFRALLLL